MRVQKELPDQKPKPGSHVEYKSNLRLVLPTSSGGVGQTV